jgi:acetylornithine deacetylase
MELDVVQLTRDYVAINSVSRRSNAEVSDLIEETLKKCSFEVEHLESIDENGEKKVSLVAKKGDGDGGLGLFSHSDTVPGDSWDRNPFDPVVEDGRLVGLGSCDMKSPLAATIVAGAGIDAAKLKKPLFIIVTADEEITGLGARQVAGESVLFKKYRPKYGVIAEPTRLVPVYAHKGGGRVIATACGRAAHTSTDQGVSANFLIAPFLAEMAELAKLFKTDRSFMNHEFNPPTIGFNMVIDDGLCRPNVTAAKTVCTLSFRPMPDDRSQDVIDMVTDRAKKYGFEVSSRMTKPFYISPDSEIVRTALKATGVGKPGTVPYGTDSVAFRDHVQLVILGPGDIA